MSQTLSSKADPITTEIIRNAFLSIAQDMNASLIRSAYTPIIYEGKDCSVALLDERGEVLGQSLGVPLFLGNLEVCVQLTSEMYGWEVFRPGDVFYMNDSYMTGTHLNDATVFAPIHWKDGLAGFAATRAHWLDVGAKDPGGSMDSREIYQEGVRWAPTRIYEGGKPRPELIDLLQRNSRFGHRVAGDLNPQVAACRTGERRLQALLDRFGLKTVRAARNEIFRLSEELERKAVRAIPDGTYGSRGFLDNDGLGNGPIPVQVQVSVKGDEVEVDLEGSSAQAEGPVNCGFAQTVSAVRVAFKLLIDPQHPVDGGTFKTLRVRAPEGSVFQAQEPAACQWYFTPLGLLIDLVVQALAPAIPEKVAAAHYGDSMVIYLAGEDPRRDHARFLSVEPTPGGWGAFAGGDGQDALINNVNGAFKDRPVEVFENKYPVLLQAVGLRSDTGGAGRFRRGAGIYREYRLQAPASLYLWFERSVTPAWGLFGGRKGAGPDVVINPGTASEQHLLKVNALKLQEGSVVRTQTGGGGGYGEPWEREPERVRRDVIDGYVSRAGARRDYGVLLKPDLSVDRVGTRKLKQSLKSKSRAEGFKKR